MRAVIQRVVEADVHVLPGSGRKPERVGRIGAGLVVLLGVRTDDVERDATLLVDKIMHLRVFEDDESKMNRSLLETGGAAMVISNFTLYGDCRKGRRPSFTEAAAGPVAEPLFRLFCETLAAAGVLVERGRFGSEMRVSLVNDGPVTLLLDSRRTF